MTKDEFKELNIDDKIKYINSKIDELGSVKRVCESVDFKSKTLTEQVRNKYTYVKALKRYMPISNVENLANGGNQGESNQVQIYAPEPSQSILPTNSIDNAQEKLLNILSNYDKIMKAVDMLNNADAQEPSQSINSDFNTLMDLNMPSTKLKKTTIRVNEEIWEAWKECIKTEFSHLEQFDLLSVALRDFINKYSVLK